MGRCLVCCLLCLVMRTAVAQSTLPNIIFIAADDLGYGDLSCYGQSRFATPQLDQLARAGMRFTDAYAAAPVCTPSRTAFMTGRYPARTPVGLKEPLDWTPADSLVGLSPATPSLPALLKRQGYRTGLVGKWHLGFSADHDPLANGFDYFFGYKGGGVDYQLHTSPQGTADLYENRQLADDPGYLTDLLAEKSIAFIASRPGQPFFLSLQFSAPHWPWQGPGDPAYPKGNSAWKEGGSSEKYARMVMAMDQAVGRLMQALRQQGLDSNTLVVFTSDNGGERFSDMGGMRERKFVLWEGGIRVPCIAYWPGRIGPGQVCRQPITHMDWTASFLAMAGVAPDHQPALDGTDIRRWLANPELTETRTFFWRVSQRNQQKAVRWGNWKLLETEKELFLFNLADDPAETHNLVQRKPKHARRLQRALSTWEASVLKPLPL